MSPWSTAAARDWKDTGGMALEGVNPDGSVRRRTDQLPRQVRLTVPEDCQMPLSPAFSAWLMGYGPEWLAAGLEGV